MAKHLLIAAVEVVVKYNLIDYSTNKKGIHLHSFTICTYYLRPTFIFPVSHPNIYFL
jgi:hypothetical protein